MKKMMLVVALLAALNAACVLRENNDNPPIADKTDPEKLFFEDSLTSGSQIGLKPGEIALTLDDGPVPESLEFAKKMAELEVPVAYFLIGQNVKANPSVAKAMSEIRFTSGPQKGQLAHIIANHSMHHKRKNNNVVCIVCDGTDYAIDEIADADKLLAPLIKAQNKPFLFRAPGGNFFRKGVSNEPAQLAKVNESLSKYIGPFFWDVDGDVNPGPCNGGAQACNDFYVSQSKARGVNRGLIVLAHDVVAKTRTMLLGTSSFPGYIARMRAAGFKFVAMDKYPADLEKFGHVPSREIGVVSMKTTKVTPTKFRFQISVEGATRLEVKIDGLEKPLFLSESGTLDTEREFLKKGNRFLTITGFDAAGKVVGLGVRQFFIDL